MPFNMLSHALSHTLYSAFYFFQIGGCLGGPCQDAPPRNTCEAHPLCSQMLRTGEMCCDLAAPPSMYCAGHTVILYTASGGDERNKGGRGRDVAERPQQPGQCSGMKTGKDKTRCKSKGTVLLGGLSWCDAHKDQYIPRSNAPSHSSTVAQPQPLPQPLSQSLSQPQSQSQSQPLPQPLSQPQRAGLTAASSALVSTFEKGDSHRHTEPGFHCLVFEVDVHLN